MKPETIEATYRIVTPMFCEGVDNTSAEFRLPSFKGALRFWWRALAWQRLGGDREKIRTQEAELFGSSDEGQAKFLLRVVDPPQQVIEKGEILRASGSPTKSGSVVGPGARYLGYGVMHAFGSQKKGHKAGQLTRSCLAANQSVSIQLILSGQATGEQRKQLKRAVQAVGIFGGLGSKARKGYGSIHIESMDGKSFVVGVDDFFTQIWNVTSGIAGKSAKGRRRTAYSAFSDGTQLCLLVGHNNQTPLELLNAVGEELIWYRSNGRVPGRSSERKVLGQAVDPENRPFWSDHELMDGVTNRRQRADRVPDRTAFGLPHNYFFSSSYKGAQVNATDVNRRASPLFFHALKLKDERPAVLISFFPGRFLPGNQRVRVKNRNVKIQKDFDEFWAPVRHFMKRMQKCDFFDSRPFEKTCHIDL